MAETDDDTETNDPRVKNYTIPSRSRPRTKEVLYNLTATFPHYFIPKRPRVVKMRDLSPETKAQLSKEYYEAYDPWTGIRIAATLGILISLFTLFLTYKSKYHKSRNAVITSKKTSLYLYEDDLDCNDLGNLGSSDDTGSFAFSYRYGVDDRLPGTHEYNFGLKECYPMEEIFVKSSVVECVALTLHKNQKGSKGPKYGTLRITDDASRSLPCSPYRQKKKTKSSTAVPQDSSSKMISTTTKQPHSPTSPPAPERDASFSGSITSFGSNDTDGSHVKPTVFSKSRGRSSCKTETACQSIKSPKTDVAETGAREDESGDSPVPKNTMVVSSKRPQDYRSRSTVVTIGRRKRKL